jgi:K+/H+ antiporter YhaU regulatory subunit KhtT
MADPSLLKAVYGTREQARKLRQAAKEGRAIAEITMDRARSLCRRVRRFDISVARTSNPTQIKQTVRMRDETLDALKQSLSDLESLRMTTSSEESAISKLKADIRKTLARPR